MSALARLSTARRLDLALFGFVFLLGAWFHNGYGWNQTARIDPIWAYVEPGPNQGTLRIDDYLPDPENGINTGDWAHNPDHSPHYYSNKAPGVTLLGIPLYLVLFHGERAVGIEPLAVAPTMVNAYLLNLWVTVLPVALSALFFLRLARRLTGRWEPATGLTVLLYAGTLMWPFSTAVWAHTTATAFLVIALTCFFAAPAGRTGDAGPVEKASAAGVDAPSGRAVGLRDPRIAPFLAGLFAGLAVLTDYGAAPFAVSLVVAAAMVRGRRGDLVPLALGGLGPAIVFGAYHWALFGSPVRLASSYSTEGMLIEGDFLGMFGRLRPEALWGLTFSPVRGIFFFMPVLLLALVALRHLRTTPHRAFVVLALANIAAALLMNLSYNTWQGGMTAGARYQIIALPFWVALLALLPARRATRWALWGLGAVSLANMLVIAAVSPMAPDAVRGSPLLFCWSQLGKVLRIDLGFDPRPAPGGPLTLGSLHFYPVYLMREWGIPVNDPLMARWAVFNLGERLFGLRGLWSLAPLVAMGCGAGWWLRSFSRRLDDGKVGL